MTAVSLVKGENVVLDKGLEVAMIGLGWDPRKVEGVKFDLDANLLLIGEDGKVVDNGIVFFNTPKSKCGSVVHNGDNLDGEGKGDDEVIEVNLSTVPESVKELLVHVVIHMAAERGQNFGQVDNAFVRIFNKADGVEEVRYDLTEDFSSQTVVCIAKLYRHNGAWKAKAIGEGFVGTLRSMGETYGVKFS